MKKIFLLAFILITFSMLAQVGINTTNPHVSSVLDLESTTKGFLPPRMTEAQMNAIATPAEGLIVYCTNCNPKGLYDFDGTSWTSIRGTATPAVVANCNVNGFAGTYIAGLAVSGTTFTVTITNNSLSTVSLSFQNSDLVLSGVSGLSVTATSPASATINAGQSQLVTYTISGTPSTSGALTGTWTKLTLTCSKVKNISNGDAIFTNATNNAYVFSVNDLALPLNNQGTLPINSTVNVPYTSGLGNYLAYTSPDVAISSSFCEDGASNWTLGYSYSAGTFSASGNIVVTLITKKAGVVTAWQAKRVANITTINFNCVAVPWSVNGSAYSNTVGIDEGGDAIRGAIAQAGGASGAAYDAGITNQLIPITLAEYNQILSTVPGAVKRGATTVTTGGYGGANTMGGANSSQWTNLPTNAYICAVSVGLNTTCTGHFRVTCAASTTGASTCLTSTTANLTFGASVYYFAVKRPTTHCGSNTFLGKINTGLTSGYIGGGISGGNGYYYNPGAGGSCGTSSTLTVGWDDALQVMTSTQKSW